jgi:hypothetical protein
MWVRVCGPSLPFKVPENQRTCQRTYPRRPISSPPKNKKKLVTSSENFKKTWNRRLFEYFNTKKVFGNPKVL